MFSKSIFPSLIAVLALLTAYLYFPSTTGNEGSNRQGAPTQVKAHTLSLAPNTISIKAIGTARANQAIQIQSAQSDYAEQVLFDNGLSVAKGTPLVVLKHDQETFKVAELKATLKDEKRQLSRLEGLAKSQSAAQSAYEEQKAKVDALSAQLAGAKTLLAEHTINAPFAGVLGRRMVSVGTFITPNTVITTLDDIATIKVDFNVPEKYLAQLKANMVVRAQADAYPDEQFVGKVTHIGSRINDVTRSLPVTASFNNPEGKLRPGMLLHVTLVLSEQNALMVPEKAIIPRGDQHFVYTIEEAKANLTEVTIETRLNGWVSIKSGLTEGQQVVTEGTMKLRPGSQVSVLEAAL